MCNCGKRSDPSLNIDMYMQLNPIDPVEWGPILWKYLHSISERIGQSGSDSIDFDEATYFENMIQLLPKILPCQECQNHARTYLQEENPLPSLHDKKGSTLRNTARQWLFDFHNAVRQKKGQPIIVNTLEEYSTLYTTSFISQAEYSKFIEAVAAAARINWVRLEDWRIWYNFSERIRGYIYGIIG